MEQGMPQYNAGAGGFAVIDRKRILPQNSTSPNSLPLQVSAAGHPHLPCPQHSFQAASQLHPQPHAVLLSCGASSAHCAGPAGAAVGACAHPPAACPARSAGHPGMRVGGRHVLFVGGMANRRVRQGQGKAGWLIAAALLRPRAVPCRSASGFILSPHHARPLCL